MRLIVTSALLSALVFAVPGAAREQRGAIEVRSGTRRARPRACRGTSLENNQGVQVVVDEGDYHAGRADVSAAFDQQGQKRDLQYEFFQDTIKARVSVRFSL